MKFINHIVILTCTAFFSIQASDQGGAPGGFTGGNTSKTELRYSYITHNRFPLFMINNMSWFSAGLPIIGHYQNKGTQTSGLTVGNSYNTMIRLATIENSTMMLVQSIPVSLLKSILQQLGVNIQQPVGTLRRILLWEIQQGAIAAKFYTLVWGKLRKPQTSPNAVPLKPATAQNKTINQQIQAQRNSFNIMYHPALSYWMRNPGLAANNGFPTNNFNIATPMGIFDVNGVQGQSISVDSLKPASVSFHNAFSPNNARFVIDPQNAVASFWSAAVMNTPTQKKITITFNIILYQNHQHGGPINPLDTQADAIAQDMRNMVTTNHAAQPHDLIQLLQNAIANPVINFDMHNQQALQKIINTLQAIDATAATTIQPLAVPKPKPVVVKPKPIVKPKPKPVVKPKPAPVKPKPVPAKPIPKPKPKPVKPTAAQIAVIKQKRTIALLNAAAKGNLAIVRQLLANPKLVNINAVNKQGLTPLMIAVVNNKPNVVRLLVNKGANTKVKNKAGLTATALAKQKLKGNALTVMNKALQGK